MPKLPLQLTLSSFFLILFSIACVLPIVLILNGSEKAIDFSLKLLEHNVADIIKEKLEGRISQLAFDAYQLNNLTARYGVPPFQDPFLRKIYFSKVVGAQTRFGSTQQIFHHKKFVSGPNQTFTTEEVTLDPSSPPHVPSSSLLPSLLFLKFHRFNDGSVFYQSTPRLEIVQSQLCRSKTGIWNASGNMTLSELETKYDCDVLVINTTTGLPIPTSEKTVYQKLTETRGRGFWLSPGTWLRYLDQVMKFNKPIQSDIYVGNDFVRYLANTGPNISDSNDDQYADSIISSISRMFFSLRQEDPNSVPISPSNWNVSNLIGGSFSAFQGPFLTPLIREILEKELKTKLSASFYSSAADALFFGQDADSVAGNYRINTNENEATSLFDDPEAFLLDPSEKEILAWSHGTSFYLINNFTVGVTQLPKNEKCVFDGEFKHVACAYNLTTSPRYNFLRQTLKRLDQNDLELNSGTSASSSQLRKSTVGVVSTADIVRLEGTDLGLDDNEVRFGIRRKISYSRDVSFSLVLIIPVKLFNRDIEAAKSTVIIIASVLVLFGSIVCYLILRSISSRIEFLAEEMAKDPFAKRGVSNTTSKSSSSSRGNSSSSDPKKKENSSPKDASTSSSSQKDQSNSGEFNHFGDTFRSDAAELLPAINEQNQNQEKKHDGKKSQQRQQDHQQQLAKSTSSSVSTTSSSERLPGLKCSGFELEEISLLEQSFEDFRVIIEKLRGFLPHRETKNQNKKNENRGDRKDEKNNNNKNKNDNKNSSTSKSASFHAALFFDSSDTREQEDREMVTKRLTSATDGSDTDNGATTSGSETDGDDNHESGKAASKTASKIISISEIPEPAIVNNEEETLTTESHEGNKSNNNNSNTEAKKRQSPSFLPSPSSPSSSSTTVPFQSSSPDTSMPQEVEMITQTSGGGVMKKSSGSVNKSKKIGVRWAAPSEAIREGGSVIPNDDNITNNNPNENSTEELLGKGKSSPSNSNTKVREQPDPNFEENQIGRTNTIQKHESTSPKREQKSTSANNEGNTNNNKETATAAAASIPKSLTMPVQQRCLIAFIRTTGGLENGQLLHPLDQVDGLQSSQTTTLRLRQLLIDRTKFIAHTIEEVVLRSTGAHLIEFRNEFYLIALRLSNKHLQSKLAFRFGVKLVEASQKISAKFQKMNRLASLNNNKNNRAAASHSPPVSPSGVFRSAASTTTAKTQYAATTTTKSRFTSNNSNNNINNMTDPLSFNNSTYMNLSLTAGVAVGYVKTLHLDQAVIDTAEVMKYIASKNNIDAGSLNEDRNIFGTKENVLSVINNIGGNGDFSKKLPSAVAATGTSLFDDIAQSRTLGNNASGGLNLSNKTVFDQKHGNSTSFSDEDPKSRLSRQYMMRPVTFLGPVVQEAIQAEFIARMHLRNHALEYHAVKKLCDQFFGAACSSSSPLSPPAQMSQPTPPLLSLCSNENENGIFVDRSSGKKSIEGDFGNPPSPAEAEDDKARVLLATRLALILRGVIGKEKKNSKQNGSDGDDSDSDDEMEETGEHIAFGDADAAAARKQSRGGNDDDNDDDDDDFLKSNATPKLRATISSGVALRKIKKNSKDVRNLEVLKRYLESLEREQQLSHSICYCANTTHETLSIFSRYLDFGKFAEAAALLQKSFTKNKQSNLGGQDAARIAKSIPEETVADDKNKADALSSPTAFEKIRRNIFRSECYEHDQLLSQQQPQQQNQKNTKHQNTSSSYFSNEKEKNSASSPKTFSSSSENHLHILRNLIEKRFSHVVTTPFLPQVRFARILSPTPIGLTEMQISVPAVTKKKKQQQQINNNGEDKQQQQQVTKMEFRWVSIIRPPLNQEEVMDSTFMRERED